MKLTRITKIPLLFFLLAFPASSHYKLDTYGIGSGGGIGTSTTYKSETVSGEQSGAIGDGTTYNLWPGLIFTQTANTPTAPTVTNPSNFYNKLLLVINQAGNASDATYSIAVSTDNFATVTNYVQSDGTVGATLGAEDWQTYTNWGGGSGEYVIGLSPNTTYYFKVQAQQGLYTEGPWGPVASLATSSLSLSFDIDVSSIDEETAAPYAVSLGTLAAGSVVTSTDKIWIDLTTNAVGGGVVYVYGNSGGLLSSSTGHTISGVSADLTSISEGYGIRSLSAAQSSGGPLVAQSPYNGASENVGTVTTTAAPIYGSSSTAVTSGRGSLAVKAKIQNLTPSASDYSETVTFIAAGTF